MTCTDAIRHVVCSFDRSLQTNPGVFGSLKSKLPKATGSFSVKQSVGVHEVVDLVRDQLVGIEVLTARHFHIQRFHAIRLESGSHLP
jgi:hypothetical protein